MLLASCDVMRMVALGFLAGVCLLQTRSTLDAGPAAAGIALACVLLGALFGASARGWAGRYAIAACVVATACATGFAWAAQRAEWRMADALAHTLEGQDISVAGRITGLPQPLAGGWRFVFEPDAAPEGVPARIQLSWYENRRAPNPLPALQAGERWHFVVRLRPPHGFANPHGFDYEGWLLERAIRATGYVRADAELLDAAPSGVMQWVHRQRGVVRERILAALPEGEHAGVLAALAVGDQRAIAEADWTVFRNTGIGHLVAVSGLHVSLVGLLCGGLCSLAWRRAPGLALRLPVHKARALAALAGASAYALLAGLGLPVLRAWLMLAVAVLALLSGRRLAASRVLAAALLVVLVADPWAVLSAGFWMSFAAVAIILAVLGGRVRPPSGWRAALRVQLAISFALAPALLALFQSFPLVSPLANLVAIPAVSFVIAPLVLLALIVPVDGLFVLAHGATVMMMDVVRPLAELEHALWEQARPPPWLIAAGALAVAMLLLPRATPGRLAAPALLAGLALWAPPRPEPGAFVARTLDVGQGLAVHVQTHRHDMLFDAGPAYGMSADAGSRVILPYLRAHGVAALDLLVLSHDDIDHVGGASSLLEAMSVGTVLAGPHDADARWGAAWAAQAGAAGTARRCQRGQAWEWDGVRFEVLHPGGEVALAGSSRHDNDNSCVLRVLGPGGALLLTGDIGRNAEAQLIAREREGLESDVVLSPHHGSRSSSSQAFVAATSPEHVIHSAGRRNAFGHPHPEVLARWTQAGTRNWRTDSQGAVTAAFPARGGERVRIRAERTERTRYWHGR